MAETSTHSIISNNSETSSSSSVVAPQSSSISSLAELKEFCFPSDLDLVSALRNHSIAPPQENEYSVEALQSISQKALPDLMELTVSRTGRELQRWISVNNDSDDDDTTPNCRLTVGCIPILRDGRIVLVSSSKSPDVFVLPKGGWERDESQPLSALRETLEEAGVSGLLGPPLGTLTFETKKATKRRLSKEKEAMMVKNGCRSESTELSNESSKSPTTTTTGKTSSHHHTHNRMTIFPLYVQAVYDEWPEQTRLRRAVTLEQASILLQHRPEFAKMLQVLAERNLHHLSTSSQEA